MKLISALLVLFIIPTLLSLFLQLFTEWCPWLGKRLVRRAARRLPERIRDRYEEEWTAELEALTGDGRRVSAIVFAMWIVLQARSMARTARGLPPVNKVLLQVLLERARRRVMIWAKRPIPEGLAQFEWTQQRHLGPLRLRRTHRSWVETYQWTPANVGEKVTVIVDVSLMRKRLRRSLLRSKGATATILERLELDPDQSPAD